MKFCKSQKTEEQRESIRRGLEGKSGSIYILTYWGVCNYGGFAQAYALNKVVSKIVNQPIKHIQYLKRSHAKEYFSFHIKDGWKGNVEKYRRGFAFRRAWKMIPHTPLYGVKKLTAQYFDRVITGSDAVWEYSVKQNADSILFGNHLRAGSLISYAASFGDVNLSNTFPQCVKDGLSHYDFLSVRDESSKKIVNKLIGKEAMLVLDPTLLYDFSRDPIIIKAEIKYKKYILVYGNDFGQHLQRYVKRFSKEKKLEIISVGMNNAWVDINLPFIDPINWIAMFMHADYVVTCTFHGLMFGIQFHKSILFNCVPYVENRSRTLLKVLELDDFGSPPKCGEISFMKLNWKEIEEKLETLRQVSRTFLKGALHE